MTLSGLVDRSGSILKTGTGTLILSNASNSYTGGTSMAGGILSVGSDGVLGNTSGGLTFDGGALQTTATFSSARTVTMTGNGTVNTDSATTLTLSGIINGGPLGRLTKEGTGTLILSGVNTYSGGTTVTTGTLQGNTSSLQGNITNNATVIFDQGTTGTYAGNMSGTGALIKNGVGTLILTGTNGYTGETTVSTGTLQGNTSSLQGNITNNATVIFDQGTTGTYAGNMSGTGALIKDGVGTLILGGVNTYSGETTVSTGTLQGNTSSLQGAITNNSAVIFDQATTGTYAGVMSGAGALTKRGGGTLTLGSASNSYEGGTSISDGILAVGSDGNLGNASGGLTFDGGALQTTATFSSARTVTMNGNGTVNTDPSTTLTLSGIINGGALGRLTKEGTGTLILSGVNTYSGETTVTAGTLQGNTS